MSFLRIWGRDEAKVQSLILALKGQFPATDFTAATDLEKAARTSDVIVTATGAKEPLIQHAWLRPGQHVTSVGSDDATKCEIDPAALVEAQVYVEARSSGEAFGTPHRAIAMGLIGAEDLAELGAALGATVSQDPHRTSIVCLSGLGVQDLTAVQAIWQDLTRSPALNP
jgi:ornithine cyclodeaminase